MPQKKESGIALVMALFILIVIMMLGAVFTMMMASETNTSVRESQSTKALYLADAGLQYAQYSAGKTSDWITLDDAGSNSFSQIVTTGQSFSAVFSGAYSSTTTSYVWASSWGYVYDSTLDYSAARYVACKLTK